VLIVVSYDIPNNRRRTKLAHALKDWGERVQLSVFECLLAAGDLDKLEATVLPLIDAEEDNLRIYALCEICRGKMRTFGRSHRTEDPEIYVL
jgi:CRISPR-associated protein Cas2